jgi:NhaP-type Na+/H+ or K+/H+ antiporter
MSTAWILALGVGLLLAVITSALASRSALSTSAVFLATGVVAGPLVLDVVDVERHVVEVLAEVALFAILFTDGQHAPWRVVRRHWALPTAALFVAMPLTFVAVAALGHWVVGLPWPAALILGAVLAPTDPVFASALVGRDEVPQRVRHLLNVESGLNDGLALPVVLALIGTAGGHPERWSTNPWRLVGEVGFGVALGVVVPIIVRLVLHVPGVGSAERLRPLGPIAVAVLLFGLCAVLPANQFVAAFVAGVTIASVAPQASDAFRDTGELVTELVKGAALLGFASLLDAATIGAAGWSGLALAVGVLVLARPVPVLAVLGRSRLSRREKVSVAWFGPRGFASVAYVVIVVGSDTPGGEAVLALTAVTVLVSVLAHSSTDVAVAKWLSELSDSDSEPASSGS